MLRKEIAGVLPGADGARAAARGVRARISGRSRQYALEQSRGGRSARGPFPWHCFRVCFSISFLVRS